MRSALPEQPEFHRVQNAGHYDFLPPCDAHLAAANPTICTSLPGFDRAAFHTKFNAEVVQFFGKALQWPLDAASTYSSPLRATVRAGSLSCKVGSKRSPLMSAKRHKRTSARFPKADI